MRVLIVEDHALLAQSLMIALRADGYDVTRPSGLDPRDVLAAARAAEPEIVLLDLHIGPDGETSTPLIEPLAASGASVVVVTGETDPVLLAECVEAGAAGIISKHEELDSLVAAVRNAAERRTVLSPSRRDELLDELRRRRAEQRTRLWPFELLTPKEREVLLALMEGRSAEQIAELGFVSMSTVRTQIRAILSKLGVNTQLAAVAMAHRAGWVSST